MYAGEDLRLACHLPFLHPSPSGNYVSNGAGWNGGRRLLAPPATCFYPSPSGGGEKASRNIGVCWASDATPQRGDGDENGRAGAASLAVKGLAIIGSLSSSPSLGKETAR